MPTEENLPDRDGELCCPHCRWRATRRTSRPIVVTLREIYYQCSNLACGHTWKASLVYDYGLVPSAIPDPKVNLPLKPMDRQTVMTAKADAKADPNQPRLFDWPGGPSPAAA
ncbi:ogr/Delta-like zinc finger family protein [Novosphingobium rosa]|uniref:ogr/Delta-like zinc finger family protein n=1 Tax=Novosphingobium rosa TaxID=76978 RepID=UPI000A5AC7C7|nr:ogr/Delta-like zinc finger family protein [Novosphingobium rosa]